jgi:hypothetical protein
MLRRPTKMSQGPLRRINMKMDATLVEWAFKYAQRHSITLTKLIETHFRRLKEQEVASLQVDADQV